MSLRKAGFASIDEVVHLRAEVERLTHERDAALRLQQSEADWKRELEEARAERDAALRLQQSEAEWRATLAQRDEQVKALREALNEAADGWPRPNKYDRVVAATAPDAPEVPE